MILSCVGVIVWWFSGSRWGTEVIDKEEDKDSLFCSPYSCIAQRKMSRKDTTMDLQAYSSQTVQLKAVERLERI